MFANAWTNVNKWPYCKELPFCFVFIILQYHHVKRWISCLQIKVGHRTEAKDGTLWINIYIYTHTSLIWVLHIFFCYPGINRTALREIKLLQELSHPNIIGVSHIYMHINLWCVVVNYGIILTSINPFLLSAPGCFWPQIQYQSCLWLHGDRSRGDSRGMHLDIYCSFQSF